jgi:hypothetical protein
MTITGKNLRGATKTGKIKVVTNGGTGSGSPVVASIGSFGS